MKNETTDDEMEMEIKMELEVRLYRLRARLAGLAQSNETA